MILPPKFSQNLSIKIQYNPKGAPSPKQHFTTLLHPIPQKIWRKTHGPSPWIFNRCASMGMEVSFLHNVSFFNTIGSKSTGKCQGLLAIVVNCVVCVPTSTFGDYFYKCRLQYKLKTIWHQQLLTRLLFLRE
jgi:hypothetical protein